MKPPRLTTKTTVSLVLELGPVTAACTLDGGTLPRSLVLTASCEQHLAELLTEALEALLPGPVLR